MFSLPTFSNPFTLPRILSRDLSTAIDIKSVEIHNVEGTPDRRARSLRHLLKLNHVNHSIIYHDLRFDNHLPHILGSAYLLGASSAQLTTIYEEECRELEKWEDSPGEVSKHDWRDFLGDRRYQRAYVDFFEDELVTNGYEWRKVLEDYLLRGKEPLINCLIAGLGHPLIHLGYAYELSSREVGMEALGLVATSYNFLHKYINDASYTTVAPYSTSSPLEVLYKVGNDSRLSGLFDHPGADNIEALFLTHEDIILEHWNAWKIMNPKKQFEESQRAAVALLVATQSVNKHSYDFFLVHLLTTSHAVRILIPLIPAKHHASLVRQWWLMTLAVYIAQLRPPIKVDIILEYDQQSKAWGWVEKQAVSSRWATDAHYVKGLRAMKEASQTWGDEDHFYLKAAVKFALEFNGWGGFGPLDGGNVN